VVSYGDLLHRALDAVDKLRDEGHDVGLVNKAHLNAVDEQTMARIGAAPFVALFESQNRKTGLGARFGTQLLERGHTPVYRHFGVTREGSGGLGHQILHQGLDSASIHAAVSELLKG
jgi:transketolase C-terminal domain/subunit